MEGTLLESFVLFSKKLIFGVADSDLELDLEFGHFSETPRAQASTLQTDHAHTARENLNCARLISHILEGLSDGLQAGIRIITDSGLSRYKTCPPYISSTRFRLLISTL